MQSINQIEMLLYWSVCVCVFFPPWSVHPSSSLQMFTVLSIDPVAISGEVGEKQQAVTYLQQRTPSIPACCVLCNNRKSNRKDQRCFRPSTCFDPKEI